jgi:hypothetical protein
MKSIIVRPSRTAFMTDYSEVTAGQRAAKCYSLNTTACGSGCVKGMTWLIEEGAPCTRSSRNAHSSCCHCMARGIVLVGVRKEKRTCFYPRFKGIRITQQIFYSWLNESYHSAPVLISNVEQSPSPLLERGIHRAFKRFTIRQRM